MKKYFSIMLVLIFVVIGVGFLTYYQSFQDKEIKSPLPQFLSQKDNNQVSSLDFWLPSIMGFFDSNSEVPNLTAKSVLVYDLEADEPLFEKNPNARLPMASLTKLMTAMVAIDNKRPDDRYLVKPEHLVGENTIGLSEGEIMGLEELLYGVFMYSANDAAETLADSTMGREDFIIAMNNKAKALGLENTNFTNPTGLQGDGDQYSTASDLLVLSRHALENYPEIAKAASTPEYYIAPTEDNYEYYLYSQLNLLTTYPGVKGLKDGYTPEAGWCLITYIEYEDKKLVGVILGSENRREEMINLLDYSLNKLDIVPPPHS